MKPNRNLKAHILIFYILIFSIIWTGCYPTDSDIDNGYNQTDNRYLTDLNAPKKESEIVMSLPYIAEPLKPGSETEVAFYELIYKNFVQIDENQQVKPSIALSWEITENTKQWKFIVDENAYFHDGTKLTPEDVIYTINKIKSYGKDSEYYYNVKNIKSCEVSGNDVLINLSSEDFTLPWKLNLPVVSMKYYENRESAVYLNGTGSFKAISADENEILLQKSDDDKLKVRLKKVESSKDTKSILKPGNDPIAVVSREEGILYERRVDLFLNEYTGNTFEFISFNTSATFLNKSNIRKAISYFIDIEGIVKEVYGENAVRADYPVHPQSFLTEWSIGAVNQYNPDLGSELLKIENIQKSGGKYQRAQLVTAYDSEGKPYTYYKYTPLRFEILVNAFDEKKIQVAEMIKMQLEENGIQINLNVQSGQEIMDLVRSKKYDILISSVSLGDVPDPEIMAMLYSKDSSDSMLNVCNINNQELNGLYESAKKATKLSEFIEQLENIQMYLKDNAQYIGLGYLKQSCVYSRDITGTFAKDPFTFFRNPEDLKCN